MKNQGLASDSIGRKWYDNGYDGSYTINCNWSEIIGSRCKNYVIKESGKVF
jgi:hypothetical protein